MKSQTSPEAQLRERDRDDRAVRRPRRRRRRRRPAEEQRRPQPAQARRRDRGEDCKKGAVTSGKLAPKAVIAGKLGPNAVLPGNIGNGAITSAKIGAGAVIASSIKNGVDHHQQADQRSRDHGETRRRRGHQPILANGSVTPAKLSNEVGPIVATLKSGQTLRGVFDVGGSGESTEPASSAPRQRSSSRCWPPPAAERACCTARDQRQPARASAAATRRRRRPRASSASTSPKQRPRKQRSAIDAGSNNRLGFGLWRRIQRSRNGQLRPGPVWAVTAP